MDLLQRLTDQIQLPIPGDDAEAEAGAGATDTDAGEEEINEDLPRETLVKMLRARNVAVRQLRERFADLQQECETARKADGEYRAKVKAWRAQSQLDRDAAKKAIIALRSAGDATDAKEEAYVTALREQVAQLKDSFRQASEKAERAVHEKDAIDRRWREEMSEYNSKIEQWKARHIDAPAVAGVVSPAPQTPTGVGSGEGPAEGGPAAGGFASVDSVDVLAEMQRDNDVALLEKSLREARERNTKLQEELDAATAHASAGAADMQALIAQHDKQIAALRDGSQAKYIKDLEAELKSWRARERELAAVEQQQGGGSPRGGGLDDTGDGRSLSLHGDDVDVSGMLIATPSSSKEGAGLGGRAASPFRIESPVVLGGGDAGPMRSASTAAAPVATMQQTIEELTRQNIELTTALTSIRAKTDHLDTDAGERELALQEMHMENTAIRQQLDAQTRQLADTSQQLQAQEALAAEMRGQYACYEEQLAAAADRYATLQKTQANLQKDIARRNDTIRQLKAEVLANGRAGGGATSRAAPKNAAGVVTLGGGGMIVAGGGGGGVGGLRSPHHASSAARAGSAPPLTLGSLTHWRNLRVVIALVFLVVFMTSSFLTSHHITKGLDESLTHDECRRAVDAALKTQAAQHAKTLSAALGQGAARGSTAPIAAA